MARLIVAKTNRIEIPGLARNKGFHALSEKRITRAVRESLRQKYGSNNVKVSCAAMLEHGMWTGTCWIDGVEQPYQLHAGLFGPARLSPH
jgi:hypothetical protein